MISVLAELWPYLLLFYLFDCIKYLGSQEIGLRSFTLTQKRFGSTLPGGLFLTLLPGGVLLRADQTPIALTTERLYLPTAKQLKYSALTAADFVAIDYATLQSVAADGRDLLLNGKAYLKAGSNAKAQLWAAQIQTISATPKAKRQAVIQKFYNDRLDLHSAQAAWARDCDSLLMLATLCRSLFLLLLVLLPLRLYTDYFAFVRTEPLIWMSLFNFIAVLGMSGYVYRHIYNLSTGKVTTELLLMLISPLSSLQAPLHVAANLFYRYDWLTVVALLQAEPHFYSHVRQRLHHIDRLTHALADPEWAAFWSAQATLVDALVEQTGVSRQTVFQTPAHQDPSSHSYCPLCHSEYRAGFDQCLDCQAMLVPFGA